MDSKGSQVLSTPIGGDVEDSPKPMSKKAQKKAAKAARMAELKVERRAREKEAKKRKRRERAEAERERLEAGDGDEEAGEQQRTKRQKLSRSGAQQTTFNAKVVVDLGFDDMMIDKEIVSLTSQLAYTYGANRRASRPFSGLIFTSLNGRTKVRLDSMNDSSYKRWASTEWWVEGYERLWAPVSTEELQQLPDGESEQPHQPSASYTRSRKADVVYLTADTDEELTELKEGEVYIIGGICDHNRYKDLCLNKANEAGIRTARLPIGRYLASLKTRKVLTVNQVFEILLKWTETQDWEGAFWSVIPKRKFQGSEIENVSTDPSDEKEQQMIEQELKE